MSVVRTPFSRFATAVEAHHPALEGAESPPCTAARNVVLLGDPQQLEQPIQGSHPGGCDTNEEPSLDLDD